MIDDREIRDRAAQLGVSEAQVRRDHLLSHLIRALESDFPVVFIGGTALNRTHLPDVRLSEDLDLHLIEGKADAVVDVLLDAVRLEFPGITVVSRSRREDVTTNILAFNGLQVQVQVVVRRHEWLGIPAGNTPVRLKYSDLPPTVDLVVPTLRLSAR